MDYPHEADRADDIEVELASPWLRVAAYLINNVIFSILCIPMVIPFFTFIIQMEKEKSQLGEKEFMNEMVRHVFTSPWMWLGLMLLLAYSVVQIVMISKSGQSIAKKLLNIKIIREDGSEGGFVYNFLVREAAYTLALTILAILIALPFGDIGGGLVSNFVSYGAMLVCLIMMFAARDRRTLQDMLAGTVVVQLPPPNRLRPPR